MYVTMISTFLWLYASYAMATSKDMIPSSLSLKHRKLPRNTTSALDSDDKAFTSGSFATGTGPIPNFGNVSPAGGLSYVFECGENTVNLTFDKCASNWDTQIGLWSFLNGTTAADASFHDILSDAIANQAQYGNTVASALDTAIINNLDAYMNDANAAFDLSVCNDTTPDTDDMSTVLPSNIDVNVNTELRRLLFSQEVKDRIRGATVIIGIGAAVGVYASAIQWSKDFSGGFDYSIVIPGLIASGAFIISSFGLWIAVAQNRQLITRLINAGGVARLRQTGTELAGQLRSVASGGSGGTTQPAQGTGGQPGDPATGGGSLAPCNPWEAVQQGASASSLMANQQAGVSTFSQLASSAAEHGEGQC